MTTLITGGNGFLANSLKNYIDGDFYGKDMLDLTDTNCINNLREYDILIHTAASNIDISLNVKKLIDQIKPKKIFAFTSRQGTFLNWKKDNPLNYGLEKLILNFTIYRHNLSNHNAVLIEPGHMKTTEQYNASAKKFEEIYKDFKFEKNMILNLHKGIYLPY